MNDRKTMRKTDMYNPGKWKAAASCLFAVYMLIMTAACGNPLAEKPAGRDAGEFMTVHIRKAESAERTAVPGTLPDTGWFRVYICAENDAGTVYAQTETEADNETASVALSLSRLPASGNMVVRAEGFDSDDEPTRVLLYEGEGTAFTVASVPASVHITLVPVEGAGTIELEVHFPQFSGGDIIESVKVNIFTEYSNIAAGTPYATEVFEGTSIETHGGSRCITFELPDVPAGQRYLTLAFVRADGKTVYYTEKSVIVQNENTTNRWLVDGKPEEYLSLEEADFISSNTRLAGISLVPAGETGSVITDFDSDTETYLIIGSGTTDKHFGLSLTLMTEGQSFVASLNGHLIQYFNSVSPYEIYTLDTDDSPLLEKNKSNSLVITVTAPDGVTRKTYTITYLLPDTGSSVQTVYYVSEDGTETGTGDAPDTALNSVQLALNTIRNTNYNNQWPGYGTDNVSPAVILVSGKIEYTSISGINGAVGVNGMVDITGTNANDLYATYPPIILMGAGTGDNAGILDAEGGSGSERRVLYMENADVTLADNLTLTGGYGGTLNNTKYGGGVHVNGGTFTMSGGTISDNLTGDSGGGVYVTGSGSFIMSGGNIVSNTAISGGAVYITTASEFEFSGGIITRNTATSGAVYIYTGQVISLCRSGRLPQALLIMKPRTAAACISAAEAIRTAGLSP
ncbi:hypothetical protein K7I13_05670 [Brucepastera parasyntrophica]|uniref:hypothetical protein n=1 Tax=Brucepastera parasyntrophica TaxID=2880008 RepID=UPI00210E6565|nr:hypothetical protein [Brucepastera parasyntrophica]ULQ60757.1 hypothetical protein K7I13_05670 [Brucepastera parasyntrophica]